MRLPGSLAIVFSLLELKDIVAERGEYAQRLRPVSSLDSPQGEGKPETDR
jgi:hypothetical protein